MWLDFDDMLFNLGNLAGIRLRPTEDGEAEIACYCWWATTIIYRGDPAECEKIYGILAKKLRAEKIKSSLAFLDPLDGG